MSLRSEMDSPVSTAGHHVSAVTLGEGIFRTGRGGDRDSDLDSGDEFDPERSLGRLVGELGKVMHGVSVSLPCHVFMTMFGASHTDLFSGYRLDPHRRSQPCPLLDHHPHIPRSTPCRAKTSHSP